MSAPTPVLFSYFRSSCSWRVRIALEYKEIDYEYRPINLVKNEQLSDQFRLLNPSGQVPAMVIEEASLTQSLSIIEFLEEMYPSNPLLPKGLLERAKVREVSEIIACGIQPLQNLAILRKIGDEKKMEWGHDVIQNGFQALETVLAKCSGKYCVGDDVTMSDCCLVPQVYNANRFKVDMKPFPVIQRVHSALMELEAVKRSHPSKQPDCPEDLK